MKKIVYISYDSFFDTDKTVLKKLSNNYPIDYYIIKHQTSSLKDLEVEQYANKYSINLINCIYTTRKRHPKQLIFYFNLFLKVRQNKKQDTVIYFEADCNIYLATLAVLLLKRKKTIIAFHDIVLHTGAGSKLMNLSFNILQKYYTNFQVFSNVQKNQLLSKVPSKKVFTIPMMKKEYGISSITSKDEKQINFLFFGRIEYYKGLDLLINACESLVIEGKTNFKLTIAGRGDYWNDCKALIKSESIYDLKIRFIKDDEIAPLFDKSDYLVLPYRDVTQSGPLMIAYNYNIPVIATKSDGFEEFILNGQNGFLFEKNTVTDLKMILNNCINLSQENYQDIKKSLATFVDVNFSDSVILNKYYAMFNEVN